MVHQDLKPESLFLTQSGTVKVTDFELVRLGEFTSARRPHGRASALNVPTYFAPEFAEGGSANAVSDVYAMGLCLYEFLAGEPPYPAGSGTETQATIAILLQHLTKPLPELRQFRKDVPDALLAILHKATAKQPQSRYQSADEFGAALMPYLGHPEVHAAPLRAQSQLFGEYPTVERTDSASIELRYEYEATANSASSLPTHEQDAQASRQQKAPENERQSSGRGDPKSEGNDDHKDGLGESGWSPLEVTAPQPSRGELPAVEGSADSRKAKAKEPFFVKLRYLLFGVLVTLLLVGGTAATTAYFMRFVLHLAPPPAEAPVRPELLASATVARPTPLVGAAVALIGASLPSNMVQIPSGTFRMGSRDGYPDERPEHVESMVAFWLDRHEVTTGEYEKCVAAGECRKQKSIRQSDADHKFDRFCNYGRKSRDDHPMNCVDWYQARAYCRWVGKRLPSEIEWEYAARGSDGRKYPWGGQAPSETQLNACGRECVILGAQVGKKWGSMYAADDGWDATAPVGSFASDKSPFGVMDLAGNVAEWTDTEYAKCYRDDCEPDGKERVIRGGAWNDDERRDVRAAYRNRDIPLLRGSFVGFRCAKNEVPSAPPTH